MNGTRVCRFLVLAGLLASGSVASQAGEAEWGEPVDGLACRLEVPSEVVPLGARPEFRLHLRYDGPDGLSLSWQWVANQSELLFRDVSSGKILRRTPDDGSAGWGLRPGEPVEVERIQKGGELVVPLPVRLLTKEGQQLPPGTYVVTARYQCIASPPIRLTVRDASPAEESVAVPSRLTFHRSGDRLSYGTSREDVTTVKLVVRPGYFLAVRTKDFVSVDGSDYELLASGLCTPGAGLGWELFIPREVAKKATHEGRSLAIRVEIEILETSYPTDWHRTSPESGDHRTLWKGEVAGLRPDSVRHAVPEPTEEAASPHPPDEVKVPAEPGRMIAFDVDGGRRLAVLCYKENRLAIVDVARRSMERAVTLPVRAKGAGEGEPLTEFLNDVVAAPEEGVLWVSTFDGRIFRIAPETGEATLAFDDPDVLDLRVAWDAPRRRLLVTGEQEGDTLLWSLAGGKEPPLAQLSRSVTAMLVQGDRLRIALMDDAVCGEGEQVSELALFDLKTDRLVESPVLPIGFLTDLAPGMDGRFYAADGGLARILDFGPDARRPGIRHLEGFWAHDAVAPFSLVRIAADGGRLFVPEAGGKLVHEYAIQDGLLSNDPVREYTLQKPTQIPDVVALPDGTAAICCYELDTVRFLTPADARPFSGWEKER